VQHHRRDEEGVRDEIRIGEVEIDAAFFGDLRGEEPVSVAAGG